MKIHGRPYRTIWVAADGWSVEVIDQTKLPFKFATKRLASAEEAAEAIKSMVVRGAPLIGATAAYGLCMALRVDASDEALERAYELLLKTRPTAINLKWALDEMMAAVRNQPKDARVGGGLCARGEAMRRRCGDERGDRAARIEADRGDRASASRVNA